MATDNPTLRVLCQAVFVEALEAGTVDMLLELVPAMEEPVDLIHEGAGAAGEFPVQPIQQSQRLSVLREECPEGARLSLPNDDTA